jgi:hypothetical protein
VARAARPQHERARLARSASGRGKTNSIAVRNSAFQVADRRSVEWFGARFDLFGASFAVRIDIRYDRPPRDVFL